MSSSKQQPLRVLMFGSFEVFHGEDPVPDKAWGRKKTKDLLKILLSNRGQTFTQDQLIDLLYPDADPDKVIKNLRGRVSELRKALEPDLKKGPDSQFILNIGQGYVFNGDADCWVDVEKFEQHLQTAQQLVSTQRWAEALDEYNQAFQHDRGLFLADEPYEDWAIERRRRFETNYVAALEQRARCHSQLGQPQLALGVCEQLLEKDPHLETAYQLKMRTLYELGERQKALDTYENCVQQLDEHMDVEPSEDTKKLYLQISKGQLQIKQSALPPNNLPVPFSPFVGRSRELEALSDQLQDPGCRILTLMGPGGIGKSRLSVQLATNELKNFPDGAFWVPLAGVQTSDFVPAAIAQALSFNFYGSQPPHLQLANFLKDKRMLLVLDNFEHLADGATLLGDMLQQAPQVVGLVTSRVNLNIEGEWVFALEGLAVPPGIEDEDWQKHEAVELFLNTARKLNVNLSLARQKSDMIEICQLVKGSPLGIELAASWIELLSCAEILKEIKSSMDFLASELKDLPERQRSVRATFEYSWKLLSQQEQEAVGKLSLFRGGFNRSAMAQVADLALTTLSNLFSKSFVRRLGEDRYEMHELLREFAEEKLHQMDELWSQTRTNHGQCYMTLLERRHADLLGKQQVEALAEIETEINNIRAAWAWASEAEPALLYNSMNGLFFFYDIKSWLQEGQAVFTALKDRFSQSEPKLLTKSLGRLGWFVFRLGEMDQAKALYEQGMALAEEHGINAEIAFISNYWGILTRILGEKELSKQLHEKDLALSKKSKDVYGQARAMLNLGNIVQEMGDYEVAKTLFYQSLEKFQQIENNLGAGKALGNLGRIARLTGDLEEAKDKNAQALAIDRELGDELGVTMMCGNLGNVFKELGDIESAKPLYQEALEISEKMGETYLSAINHHNLGIALFLLDDEPSALPHLKQCLLLAKEIQVQPLFSAFILGITPLMLKHRDKDDVIELIQQLLHHPITAQENKDEAKRLLKSWEVAPDESFTEQAKDIILEDIVDDLLETLLR